MPCSCQTSKTSQPETAQASSTPSIEVDDFPHEVLPGESCIYCAQKHLSVAYTISVTGSSRSIVIGELELARRHTAIEYAALSAKIAQLIYDYLTSSPTTAKRIRELLDDANDLAACVDPDARSENGTMELKDEPADNALVGQLHLCAACRLAFEVGYMEPNRSMIIGDLALAREDLTRLTYDSNKVTRDLRHRIQNRSASDLSEEWTAACTHVDNIIQEHRDDIVSKCSEGLKEYLGLSETAADTQTQA